MPGFKSEVHRTPLQMEGEYPFLYFAHDINSLNLFLKMTHSGVDRSGAHAVYTKAVDLDPATQKTSLFQTSAVRAPPRGSWVTSPALGTI